MGSATNRLRLIFSAFAILLWAGLPTAGQTLPLSVLVDMSGFPNLDDNELGREGLEELSMQAVTEIVSAGLQERSPPDWTLDSDAENVLRVTMRQSGAGGEIEMRFAFPEAGMPVYIHRGQTALGYPAETTFADRLKREVDGGVFEMWPRINKTLDEMHSAWDTGEVTQLEIDHQLTDEHSRIFSRSQAKLVLGSEAAWPLKRTGNGDAYIRKLATTPSFFTEGLLRPMRYDGRRTKVELVGRFCLRRKPDAIVSDGLPNVGYACPLSGACEPVGVAPDGWALVECERDHGRFYDLFKGLPGVVSTAVAAQDSEVHWSVPSLDALHDRRAMGAMSLTGFTEFSISTRERLGLKKPADEVAMELSSNGVPIWLDGVPPAENRIPIHASSGLSLRFGLQNLHLGQRRDGCESLDARLVFYNENEPTGEEIALKSSYAALRDQGVSRMKTTIGNLEWSGRYYQPAHTGERGIFLASKKFNRESAEEREAAIQYLGGLRRKLDAANLRITPKRLGGSLGLPLILAMADDQELFVTAKIRPPRTRFPDGRYAYGLQVAVQQSDGLVQFTFDREQIAALTDLLLKARDKDSSLQSFIPSRSGEFSVYSYTQERNNGPDWACEAR